MRIGLVNPYNDREAATEQDWPARVRVAIRTGNLRATDPGDERGKADLTLAAEIVSGGLERDSKDVRSQDRKSALAEHWPRQASALGCRWVLSRIGTQRRAD